MRVTDTVLAAAISSFSRTASSERPIPVCRNLASSTVTTIRNPRQRK